MLADKPVCIELYAGLHGWGAGFVEEGFTVIGFDIEDMGKLLGIPRPPNCHLVMQDVLTLHGSQFRNATCIVASPPCQAYSYRAMPWSRAKALPPPDNTLFDACFRIQREACEAAGRHIPLIVENVRGAQKWVGRAKWHFGSYYLWGDLPALMPIAMMRKTPVGSWDTTRKNYNPDHSWKPEGIKNPAESRNEKYRLTTPIKNNGGSWFAVAHNTTSGHSRNPVHEATKGVGIGSVSWGQGKENRHPNDPRNFYSKSNGRKAASALIAKIPFALANHIAKCMKDLSQSQDV